jgi:hypothetical protein
MREPMGSLIGQKKLSLYRIRAPVSTARRRKTENGNSAILNPTV